MVVGGPTTPITWTTMAALALAAPAVLTTRSGARSLGRPVSGLAPWAHFSDGRADLARAFDDAGLTGQLRLSGHGTWIPLGTSDRP
jgi:hypothetical protein